MLIDITFLDRHEIVFRSDGARFENGAGSAGAGGTTGNPRKSVLEWYTLLPGATDGEKEDDEYELSLRWVPLLSLFGRFEAIDRGHTY